MKLFQTVVSSGDGVLSAAAFRKRALPARASMIIVLVMSTVALAVGVTVAPAQAGDQRRCVSQREYRHVGLDSPSRPGWRQARVADHFDIIGARIRYQNKPTDHSHRHIDTVWKYRKCSAWGPGGRYVAVWYDNHSFADGYMRAKRKVPNRPYALGAAYFTGR